jgi:hypothetical protein
MSEYVWLTLYAIGYVIWVSVTLRSSLPVEIHKALQHEDFTPPQKILLSAVMYGWVLLMGFAWPAFQLFGGKKAKMALDVPVVFGWGENDCSELMADQLEALAAQLPGLIAELRGVEVPSE